MKEILNRPDLHIVEFRGFERFVQGRPYWEMPVLVQRLCGICPVSHHLAAAKATGCYCRCRNRRRTYPDRRKNAPADALRTDVPVAFPAFFPPGFTRSAIRYRFRSAETKCYQVALQHRDLAVQGVMMRKYGQEVIKATAGKKIHGTGAIPGGINKHLTLKRSGITCFMAMII